MLLRSIVGMLLGAIQANDQQHFVDLFHAQKNEGKARELT